MGLLGKMHLSRNRYRLIHGLSGQTELNIPTEQKKEYKLTVRATDKTGNVQTSAIREPFPDGSTGYQMINIQA